MTTPATEQETLRRAAERQITMAQARRQIASERGLLRLPRRRDILAARSRGLIDQGEALIRLKRERGAPLTRSQVLRAQELDLVTQREAQAQLAGLRGEAPAVAGPQPVPGPKAAAGTVGPVTAREFGQRERARKQTLGALSQGITGMVPLVGTALLWKNLSPTERAASLALDAVIFLAPLRATKSIQATSRVAAQADRATTGVRLADISPQLSERARAVTRSQERFAATVEKVEKLKQRQRFAPTRDPATALPEAPVPQIRRALQKRRLASAERKVAEAETRLRSTAKAFSKTTQPGVDDPTLKKTLVGLGDTLVADTRQSVLATFDETRRFAKVNSQLASVQAAAARARATQRFGQPVPRGARRIVEDTARRALRTYDKAIADGEKRIAGLERRIERIRNLRVRSGDDVVLKSRETAELQGRQAAIEASRFRITVDTETALRVARKLIPERPAKGPFSVNTSVRLRRNREAARERLRTIWEQPAPKLGGGVAVAVRAPVKAPPARGATRVRTRRRAAPRLAAVSTGAALKAAPTVVTAPRAGVQPRGAPATARVAAAAPSPAPTAAAQRAQVKAKPAAPATTAVPSATRAAAPRVGVPRRFRLPDNTTLPPGQFPRVVRWEQGVVDIVFDLDLGTRRSIRRAKASTRSPTQTLRVISTDRTPPPRRTLDLGFERLTITPQSLKFTLIRSRARRRRVKASSVRRA